MYSFNIQSKMRFYRWLAVFALTSLFLPAYGQDGEALQDEAIQPDEAVQESSIPESSLTDELDSTVSYPASFFAQYEPISARDMLNRIPGIDSIIGGGGGGGGGPGGGGGNGRRGLGAGENQILINGKRIAGKQNDGRSVLGQIAADQVQHIEIIRGTSSELDIRSAGPIVNVILRENASSATITAEINADYYQQDSTVEPGVILSINGRGDRLNYLATLESEPRYDQQERNEFSVLGDGTPKDQTFENNVREQTNYKLSSTIGYQITNEDLLQINGLFEKSDPPRVVDREINVLDPNDGRLLVPGVPQLITQRDSSDAERQKWEFGINYVHDFGGGGQFKLIVVANEGLDSGILNRVSDANGIQENILYVNDDRRTRERIIRTSFNWPLVEGQDIEIGVEGAQTTLESNFRLGSPWSSWAASPRYGNLPGGSDETSIINEDRYEPFVVHNWQIDSNVALETSLVAEFSELSQSGSRLVTSDVTGLPEPAFTDRAEDFKFWKPKFDLRYDLSSSLQLRATINRDISQLNFRDFTSRQDNDLDSNTDSGNSDLVQEKTWRYEFNLEYRLPNDGGVLNARTYYHDIADVFDRIDTSSTTIDPDTGLPVLIIRSAPGNIGDGKRVGLELNSSIRLGFWNMPEAVFTAGVLVQDSEVKDPFINENRELAMSGRGSWNLGFRHDVTKWNVNYGFNFRQFFQNNNNRIDVDDIREFDRDAFANLFVEKVAFNGIRFRFDIMNAIDGQRHLTRTRYLGYTADGIIEEVEDSSVGSGRKFSLKIRTTF